MFMKKYSELNYYNIFDLRERIIGLYEMKHLKDKI